jgi:hypothetical protein
VHRQAPDDVIGRAQGQVGIGGVRGDRQQLFSITGLNS